MKTSPLMIELPRSIYQIFLKVLCFLSLMLLAAVMMPLGWAVVLIISAMLLSYFFRSQRRIQKLAILDRNNWSLQDQQGEVEQWQLERVSGFAGLLVLYFSQDDRTRRVSIYISRDQISALQWRTLQQFRQLQP